VSVCDLYRDAILEHYRRPRNRGALERPDRRAALYNPLCGDEIAIDLRLEGDRVAACRFHGHGCSISQASASMLAERVTGERAGDALALAAHVRALLRGEAVAAEVLARLGDLAALRGVAQFPVRAKCALLAWNALERALRGEVGRAVFRDA
jgi:nitrogen fixation NifU-like protein